jgi:two-component system chemotaxis response regulator CheB
VSLIREQLAPRLKALGDRARGAAAPAPAPPPGRERAGRGSRRAEVVAIGISTGGPNALASLLARLPADCPAPVLIVQHMPPMFTRLLALRLDAGSALDVREAVSGQVARPGQALLAPGDWHLAVERHGDEVRVVTHQEPPENSCRPAADVLFRSAARAFGAAALGVVMTGMGQDGLRGSREIHQAGGRLLAQDEESSVVWGMPGAVVRAGLADRVLPLDQLAAEIVRRVRGGVACGGLPA